MDQNTPFYQDGLQFECTRCSACCRHDPGWVFLSRNDLEKLCRATGLGEREFIDTWSREVDIGGFKRLSLKEKPNFDCIFWNDGGCSVYEHRPLQCSTYPFWSANLFSRAVWDDLEKSCPGIDRGRRSSRNEIDTLLKARREDPLIDS